MKQTLAVLLMFACVLFAEMGSAPVARWKLGHNEGGVISPLAGTVAGKLHPSGNYSSVLGVSGKALHFGMPPTGVLVPGLAFDFTKPFTVIATVRLDSDAARGDGFRAFKDIFANTGTRGPGARLTIFYGCLQFNSGDGVTSSSILTRPSECTLPVNRWFHVAVTYDGSKVTLYVDGVPVGSKPMTVTASSNTLCIGANRASAYPFQGSIDEFALYNTALAPRDIATHALNQMR